MIFILFEGVKFLLGKIILILLVLVIIYLILIKLLLEFISLLLVLLIEMFKCFLFGKIFIDELVI